MGIYTLETITTIKVMHFIPQISSCPFGVLLSSPCLNLLSLDNR